MKLISIKFNKIDIFLVLILFAIILSSLLFTAFIRLSSVVLASSSIVFLGVLIYAIKRNDNLYLIRADYDIRREIYLILYGLLISSCMALIIYQNFIFRYISLIALGLLILLEIIDKKYHLTTLLKIILLFLLWHGFLFFENIDLIGSDVYYHKGWILDSLDTGRIVGDNHYVSNPINYISSCISILMLPMLSYKSVIYLTFETIAIFPLIFIYLSLKNLGDRKLGLLAAYMICISVPYYHFITSFTPFSLSLCFMSLLMFIEGMPKSREKYFLQFTTFLALIFTHPFTSLAYLLLFLIGGLALLIVNKEHFPSSNPDLEIYYIIVILFFIALAFKWFMPINNHPFIYDIINFMPRIFSAISGQGLSNISFLGNKEKFNYDDFTFTLSMTYILTFLVIGGLAIIQSKFADRSFNSLFNRYISFLCKTFVLTFITISTSLFGILYPQRWLSLLSLIGAPIAAVGALSAFKNKYPYFISIFLILTIIAIANPLVDPEHTFFAKSKAISFTPQSTDINSANFVKKYVRFTIADPTNVYIRSLHETYLTEISINNFKNKNLSNICILLRNRVINDVVFNFDEKTGEAYPYSMSDVEKKDLRNYMDHQDILFSNGDSVLFYLRFHEI